MPFFYRIVLRLKKKGGTMRRVPKPLGFIRKKERTKLKAVDFPQKIKVYYSFLPILAVSSSSSALLSVVQILFLLSN